MHISLSLSEPELMSAKVTGKAFFFQRNLSNFKALWEFIDLSSLHLRGRLVVQTTLL